jgi:hypothetical protein
MNEKPRSGVVFCFEGRAKLGLSEVLKTKNVDRKVNAFHFDDD